MMEACTDQNGLPHAVFLRRLAGASSATALDARLGNSAFLALRLVDLLAPGSEPVHPDAFRYQHAATERACGELPATKTETAHLVGLVHSTAEAFRARDARLVVPALLAYAHYLEDELRLDEALDVLDCMLRVGDASLQAADAIATHLRIGRVNRKLTRFDEGDAAYARAGDLASAAGDVRGMLLSRAGRAIALQGRGNLAEAERVLHEVVSDARAGGHREVAAGVQHALAATLLLRGQVAEGIVHVWQAFEAYEDDASRARALGDLGTMLLTIGEVDGAERALLEVVRRGHGMQDVVSNATVELMHCASYRRDRVGFERWRAACEARTGSMPPNILADFYLKAGIGQARFGRLRHAERMLNKAVEIAELAGVHELVFRAERVKNGLRDCSEETCAALEATAEPVQSSHSVREISASLAQLSV